MSTIASRELLSYERSQFISLPLFLERCKSICKTSQTWNSKPDIEILFKDDSSLLFGINKIESLNFHGRVTKTYYYGSKDE